jgi:hypothetical protein
MQVFTAVVNRVIVFRVVPENNNRSSNEDSWFLGTLAVEEAPLLAVAVGPAQSIKLL